MKRFISCLFILLGCFVFASSQAQERYNYLAINGEMATDDAVGPYYFIAQGNSKDAFAKTDVFAQLLDLKVKFNPDTRQLVFSRGESMVKLAATSNIEMGLTERSGKLERAGEVFDSPMAILIEGSSYVPVSPLLEAFGGASDFDPANNVLFVDMSAADTVVAGMAAAAEYTTAPAPTAQLTQPRYAFHNDLSRVALNIPKGQGHTIFVAENRLAVALPGLNAANFEQALDDPYLKSLSFGALSGSLALIVDTHHALSAQGQGYRVGLLKADESRPNEDILYVDFAPGLEGQSAAALDETAVAAKAPTSVRKLVVIDAGHGGHDPGTLSSYATEEDVVLAVALGLRDELEAQGVEAILTRDDDTFLTLEERSDFAKPEINLFISIHANGVDDERAHGIETWVFGEPINDDLIELAIKENGGGSEGLARTEEALADARSVIGDIIRQGQLSYSLQLAESLQGKMVAATGAKDRGVKPNAYYVLREARSPSVLVELGFVTNPNEGVKLTQDAYQGQLAEALAEGILEFLGQGTPVASR